MKNVKSSIQTITPKIASEILAGSIGQIQRAVNMSMVNGLAAAMKDGLWQLNGESIIIDENGACVDGQHRLSAVVRSNTSITTVVINGVDSDSFHSIGTGKPRSTGDILKIAGYKDSNLVAAVSRSMYFLVKRGVNRSGLTNTGTSVAQPQTILEFIEKNNFIVEYISTRLRAPYKELHKDKAIFFSPVNAMMCLLWNTNKEEVNDFMEGVSLCENMPKEDIRMMLSNFLVKEKMQDKRNLSREAIIGVWIQAWNTYSTGGTRVKFVPSRPIAKVNYLDASSVWMP